MIDLFLIFMVSIGGLDTADLVCTQNIFTITVHTCSTDQNQIRSSAQMDVVIVKTYGTIVVSRSQIFHVTNRIIRQTNRTTFTDAQLRIIDIRRHVILYI
jgi:hypothetical protein